MSRHTPGPWEIWNGGDGVLMQGMISPKRGGIAIMCCNELVSGGVATANAHLIAAAPDMLAALEAAIECGMVPTSSAKEGGAMHYVRQAHVADQIRAAIAKAKGV